MKVLVTGAGGFIYGSVRVDNINGGCRFLVRLPT
jgi:hypothetical protein